MRFVKPIDERAILDCAEHHDLLVTVEENAVMGGAGSAVNEVLAAHGVVVEVQNIGLPDRLFDHGSRDECVAEAGLDERGIRAQIDTRLAARAGDSGSAPGYADSA